MDRKFRSGHWDNSTTMLRYLLPIFLALVSLGAHAQFRVEVSGVGMTQVPIAVATFRGDDVAPQKIAAIVSADLERSGQFRNIDTGGVVLDENSRPKYPPGGSVVQMRS